MSLLGEAAVDITAVEQRHAGPRMGLRAVWRRPRHHRRRGDAGDRGLRADDRSSSHDLRGGRGTVGKLLTDDALYVGAQSVSAVGRGGGRGNINSGTRNAGPPDDHDAAAKALEASLQNLEAVTGRIRSGEGSLGKLLNDDAMAKSLTSTTANLDAITGRLNRGEGTLGKLMTDDELYNRLNSMTDRLDKLVASLQQGEGTAGSCCTTSSCMRT